MPIIRNERELKEFRSAIHQYFNNRADSAMELLDALCSNQSARTPVELSLNPLFTRGHDSLFKAIQESLIALDTSEGRSPSGCSLIELICQTVPSPSEFPYAVFGVDCTSISRVHAHTLLDRSFVHQPTVISIQKPVTIGHSYSMMGALPQRNPDDARWSIPLDITRVSSDSNALDVGVSQVKALMSSKAVAWHGELSVNVADSAYGVKRFLHPLQEYSSLVNVVRVRPNRVFYQAPPSSPKPRAKGHPRWYGKRFALKEADTWHPPDAQMDLQEIGKNGVITVYLQSWSNMLMRGSREHPMHHHPFTLVRVERCNAEGRRIGKVMWLIVMGSLRDQIDLHEAYLAYCQRFDLEHSFRCLKQNLLLDAFQTPEVEHEQSWLRLVILAYVQLWAALPLSIETLKPWESTKERRPESRIPPSKVMQDWNRIIRLVGTPAAEVKPRGKSPGRQRGETQTPRKRHPVIKKGNARTPDARKAA
ncbi:MAG: transposase [Moorea sp. SIO3C2]|nr:transposase [Moorena sp. SIO3C2]